MKTKYFKPFASREEAVTRAHIKNLASRDGTHYCLVDGPEDNFVVCDLRTAIDLGVGYVWGL